MAANLNSSENMAVQHGQPRKARLFNGLPERQPVIGRSQRTSGRIRQILRAVPIALVYSAPLKNAVPSHRTLRSRRTQRTHARRPHLPNTNPPGWGQAVESRLVIAGDERGHRAGIYREPGSTRAAAVGSQDRWRRPRAAARTPVAVGVFEPIVQTPARQRAAIEVGRPIAKSSPRQPRIEAPPPVPVLLSVSRAVCPSGTLPKLYTHGLSASSSGAERKGNLADSLLE
jgi:hypothetical protein